MYELATRTLVRRFAAGAGSVSKLCFLGNDRLAAVGADDNVIVWDVADQHGKPAPAPAEIDRAWIAMARTAANPGYTAVPILVAAGKDGVAKIRHGVRNSDAEIKEDLDALIVQLDAPLFADREAASVDLFLYGMRAGPALIEAANRNPSAEVRKRAKAVLVGLKAAGEVIPPTGLFGEPLRLVRAVAALERIGGTEAKAGLEEIRATGGIPGAEAESALKRMK